MNNSDEENADILKKDSKSVQSEPFEATSKRTRKHRKRRPAKSKANQEVLSLNLEASHKSDTRTHSSNDSTHCYVYHPEDDEALAQKLKNFEVKNKIYPIFLSSQIKEARFFVIKAMHEDDIHKSIKYGIWCSGLEGNSRLQNAYLECQQLARIRKENIPIFLFFSLSNGGYFLGVARMTSPVYSDLFFTRWLNWKLWRGLFKVEWLLVKDVGNVTLTHIYNRYCRNNS